MTPTTDWTAWRTAARRNGYALAAVVALAVVAYGIVGFNLTLAGDDWSGVLYPEVKHRDFIAIGRWMAVPLWRLFGGGVFAPTLTLAVFVACSIVAAFLLAVALGIERPAEVWAFVSMFVLCPVLVEEINFKPNHVSIGLGLLLVTVSVVLASAELERRLGSVPGRRSAVGVLSAAALLTLGLGNQQSLVLVGLTASAGAALARWCAPGSRVASSARPFACTAAPWCSAWPGTGS